MMHKLHLVFPRELFFLTVWSLWFFCFGDIEQMKTSGSVGLCLVGPLSRACTREYCFCTKPDMSFQESETYKLTVKCVNGLRGIGLNGLDDFRL